MGKKQGQASTGKWFFQQVLTVRQPPFHLYDKGCVLEGLILIGNKASKGPNTALVHGCCPNSPFPPSSSPRCSHSSADLHQPGVRHSHRHAHPSLGPVHCGQLPRLHPIYIEPHSCVGKCSPETFSALRNWSWSGGGGNGLHLQEPGSKASSFASFTPRNSKYHLSTHSAELRNSDGTCHQELFHDIQRKGNILTRQIAPGERAKQKTTLKTKRPKGKADRDRKPGPQCQIPAQASAPPSQFIPEKLAWSKGEGRSRSTVFGNKNRKGQVRK